MIQIMIVAFIDAWYILDATDMSVISGPFETHEDACEYMKTRAWRVAQGWAP